MLTEIRIWDVSWSPRHRLPPAFPHSVDVGVKQVATYFSVLTHLKYSVSDAISCSVQTDIMFALLRTCR